MPTTSNQDAYHQVTNTATIILGWPIGQTRQIVYDKAKSCDQQNAVLTALLTAIGASTDYAAKAALIAQLVALTTPTVPDLPTGATGWVLRDCAGGVTPVADVVTDFVEEDEPAEPPPAALGLTRVTNSNPDLFTAAIEWQNNRARPVLLTQPSVPSGQTLYLFMDGQPPIAALPETYDYAPGDEMRLYAVVATSPNTFVSSFDTKSDIHFFFGTPT